MNKLQDEIFDSLSHDEWIVMSELQKIIKGKVQPKLQAQKTKGAYPRVQASI